MPTLAAGLLLLMFLPGIIEQGAPTYQAATGQTQAPYLSRWLLLTAAFYLASALCYAVRTLLGQRRSGDTTTTAPPATPPPVRQARPAAPPRLNGGVVVWEPWLVGTLVLDRNYHVGLWISLAIVWACVPLYLVAMRLLPVRRKTE